MVRDELTPQVQQLPGVNTIVMQDAVIVGIRGPEIPAPRAGADQPETQP